MVNKKSVTVGNGDDGSTVVVANTSAMEVDNDHQQDDVNAETADNNSEQATQELTQTDHLNKKLLEAFLSRINMSNNDRPAVATDSPDDSSDWVDMTT